MIITSTISAILNHKGAQVWSIPPEMMVFDAIQLMADKNVGHCWSCRVTSFWG
jgi:hypothetical protein